MPDAPETTVDTIPYGFRWGEVTVVRSCSHKGDLVLLVRSKRESLQVRITPAGFIRAYNEQTGSHVLINRK